MSKVDLQKRIENLAAERAKRLDPFARWRQHDDPPDISPTIIAGRVLGLSYGDPGPLLPDAYCRQCWGDRYVWLGNSWGLRHAGVEMDGCKCTCHVGEVWLAGAPVITEEAAARDKAEQAEAALTKLQDRYSALHAAYCEAIRVEGAVRSHRQTTVARIVAFIFGPDSMKYEERLRRFFEEACELVQSDGMTQEEAERILHVVFSRPAGGPAQEVGGVSLTLLAYCAARGYDADRIEREELVRLQSGNIDKFRKHHAEKKELGISE